MDPGRSETEAWKDLSFRTQRFPRLKLSPDASAEIEAREIPDRYRVVGGGTDWALSCREAPTLTVKVVRGMSASLKSAKPGSIFLDGAAQAPPEIDIERGVLNLDHHEGCIRAFTLSTCEQAFVLVSKGLDLQSRDWTVYANEPDLDTVLALWVLLNHRRIAQAESESLLPLIRLLRMEGAIDTHGLEQRNLCGFEPKVAEDTFAQLEELRGREEQLKRDGRWSSVELVEFTADQMRALDGMLFEPEDFEGPEAADEVGRVALGDGRLAIACRAESGIYAVEEQLRGIYGDRLGLIVLQKDDSHYTLRQVGAFSRLLERVYERLNLADPAAGNSASSDRWGGSAEIGGSPRGRGTRLRVGEILEACERASRPPTTVERLRSFTLALAITGVVSVAPLAVLRWWPGEAEQRWALAMGVLVVGAAATLGLRFRRPGYSGLRSPVGLSWLLALPLAIAAALVGGSWAAPAPALAVGWLGLLAMPIAAELVFRGVAFGWLLELVAGRDGGRARSANLLTALLYALWTTVLVAVGGLIDPATSPLLADLWTSPPPLWALGEVFLAAWLFGIGAGYLRARSESLLPPVAAHALIAVTLALVWG